MFNTLTNYLLGYSQQEAATPERDLDVRLTAVMADEDDWVLVEKAHDERDSEGDTDMSSSMESIHEAQARVLTLPYEMHHPLTLRIARSSSTSSLPCANVEESWFITPPPCFTSAGQYGVPLLLLSIATFLIITSTNLSNSFAMRNGICTDVFLYLEFIHLWRKKNTSLLQILLVHIAFDAECRKIINKLTKSKYWMCWPNI